MQAIFTCRIVNSSSVDSKPRLTKELTTTFIQNFNSKSISGKALRNKKKPSCLVLDDFCIDYHHISHDAKPERKKQYLKPRGKVVQGNGQVEFKEMEHDSTHGEKIMLSGDLANPPGLSDNEEMSHENSTKIRKLIDMPNSNRNGAILQENSPSPEELTSEQGENRYSKRKRSRKPKRFFGSEFDLHPNFDKKSPIKSIVDENKKREFSSFRSSYRINAKSEQKEELKTLKLCMKGSDKRQQGKKELSLAHDSAGTLKRSARIQLKRSKNTSNKSEKISDVKYPESKLAGTKKRKLETSRHSCGSDLNLHTKTIILGYGGDEIKLENVSPNSKDVQKVTGTTIKKSTKSPKRSTDNTSHQKPSSKYQRKHTTVSKHEKLHKAISLMADSESENCNQDEVDDKALLCHESFHGSFLDKCDNKEDLGKKLVVLRQAEKILGGKITLLHPDQVAEFDGSCEDKRDKAMNNQEPILVKGTSLQVSQIGRDKRYILFDFEERSGKKSVQIQVNPSTSSKGQVDRHEGQQQHEMKSKSKSKDVLASSKIIIDRSKGIVSIQPPAADEQKGVSEKDGERLSEGNVSEVDIQKHHKCEPGDALIVINKREKGINKIDNQSSRDDEGHTDSHKCQREMCSPEADDSIDLSNERSVKHRGGFASQSMSNDREQITQGIDDNCLTTENNMKSIYAELSFNRLLASVHEETEKTQLRTKIDGSREKACINSDYNDTVGNESKPSDRNDNYDVGVCGSVGRSLKKEGALTRISSKKPRKGDLLLHVLQKSYEIRKNETNASQKLDQNDVESSKESILQNTELRAENSAENVPVLQRNSSTRDVVLSHSVDSDSQNCALETVKGSSNLEGAANKMPGTQLKTRKMLLDELIASEGDEKDINEKTLESRIVTSDVLNKQNSISNIPLTDNSTSRNLRDLKSDLGAIRRNKVNFFKAKTASYQRPSIELISGLRNMEQKMLDINKNQQRISGQYSLHGILDSDEIILTRGICSPSERGVSWDSDRSSLEMNAGMESSSQVIKRTMTDEDSLVLDENPKRGECNNEVQESHCPALPKGVGDKDTRTGKRRRKGLWPKKHSLILRGNPQTYLRNEKIKETLLQFDGKKSKTRADCKTGVFINGADGEVKTRKTLDEPKIRCFPNCDTRSTIYSAGSSVRKSYRHAKIGVRKYPIPNRSCRRRNPVNCLKLLGNVLQGKDDTDLRTCDLLSLRKPNVAREQGEELLKQMLKLNKGILIRQDIKQ